MFLLVVNVLLEIITVDITFLDVDSKMLIL